MLCPSCQVELSMSERQGIEIDYCPKCRGIWLDRGELDKLIERSMQEIPARVEPPRQQPVEQVRYDRERDEHSRPERYGHGKYRDDDYQRRRKKSFLGELLDF